MDTVNIDRNIIIVLKLKDIEIINSLNNSKLTRYLLCLCKYNVNIKTKEQKVNDFYSSIHNFDKYQILLLKI